MTPFFGPEQVRDDHGLLAAVSFPTTRRGRNGKTGTYSTKGTPSAPAGITNPGGRSETQERA